MHSPGAGDVIYKRCFERTETSLSRCVRFYLCLHLSLEFYLMLLKLLIENKCWKLNSQRNMGISLPSPSPQVNSLVKMSQPPEVLLLLNTRWSITSCFFSCLHEAMLPLVLSAHLYLFSSNLGCTALMQVKKFSWQLQKLWCRVDMWARWFYVWEPRGWG